MWWWSMLNGWRNCGRMEKHSFVFSDIIETTLDSFWCNASCRVVDSTSQQKVYSERGDVVCVCRLIVDGKCDCYCTSADLQICAFDAAEAWMEITVCTCVNCGYKLNWKLNNDYYNKYLPQIEFELIKRLVLYVMRNVSAHSIYTGWCHSSSI